VKSVGLVTVAALVASCMLVVDPATYGDHCKFEGADTQCGACVAAKCQADVDACCRDASCDGRMTLLDTCASKHDASCNELGKGSDSLAACVARECSVVCVELRGTGGATCSEPKLAEGSLCKCSVGTTTGNDFLCSLATYPDTICCAPKGYPMPGLECSCRPLACRPNLDGCGCELAEATPDTRECSSMYCCANTAEYDPDKCSCRSKDCFPFERRVPTCALREVACPKGLDRVESCSFRVGN